MNEQIEIRVCSVGKNTPAVIVVDDAEQANAITRNLLKEATKPFDQNIIIQGYRGKVFVNPRFVTMIEASVPLVIKDEDKE